MPAARDPYPPRPCLYCGRAFAPRRPEAVYCGGACRQAADRARRAATTGLRVLHRYGRQGTRGLAPQEAHAADFRVVVQRGRSRRAVGPDEE